jgi:type IV pilus assembly protein PilM
MGKGVWGIDVSKYSAKVVRLEGADDDLTLTHQGVFPYDGAGSGDAADLDAQIKDTLAQVKSSYKITTEPVIFSLPSHSTFNRLIKLPPVDESKIPEIVKYEAQSQIPFNIDEVLWDHQVVDRDYQPGEEKEVILFAIKRDIVEQFLANISELGFNIEAIQFSPVALFNFLVRDQELEGAAVALDMGGDNTDLIVIDGTKFWVRNLPITGNDITKALQKTFNIPFEEAEKLKLKAGQSQQAQKIFNAVQPVLRDLVNEINRSMGYYKSISKTSKFEKILLLGNSTKTLNFQKFVSQSLQLNAGRVQKLNTIAVGGQIDPGELNENLATIGTALGLAIQGCAPTANRINLLPDIFRQKKELKRKQPFVIAAVAALAVLVGLAWYKEDSEKARLTQSMDEVTRTRKQIEAQNERFDKLKTIKDVGDPLENLADISSERDLVLKIMDEINPNIPNNGDWNLKPEFKLWVVDWKFEEREKPKPEGGEKSRGPAVREDKGRLIPSQKLLTATLEVVIQKRESGGDGAGRDFIIHQLLNYNQASHAPKRPADPSVVKTKNWELAEGEGATGFWRVERDATDLKWPVPKVFHGAAPDTESRFWRYRVTIELPVGADNRKLAMAGEKGGKKAAEEK